MGLLIELKEQALYYCTIPYGLRRFSPSYLPSSLDIYFFFCGWHLLFSVYMIIGIPSTGSAGIIQSVSMLSRHHIFAGILGIFASIGWTLQGVGILIYYRMVRRDFSVQESGIWREER